MFLGAYPVLRPTHFQISLNHSKNHWMFMELTYVFPWGPFAQGRRRFPHASGLESWVWGILRFQTTSPNHQSSIVESTLTIYIHLLNFDFHQGDKLTEKHEKRSKLGWKAMESGAFICFFGMLKFPEIWQLWCHQPIPFGRLSGFLLCLVCSSMDIDDVDIHRTS